MICPQNTADLNLELWHQEEETDIFLGVIPNIRNEPLPIKIFLTKNKSVKVDHYEGWIKSWSFFPETGYLSVDLGYHTYTFWRQKQRTHTVNTDLSTLLNQNTDLIRTINGEKLKIMSEGELLLRAGGFGDYFDD